MYRGEKVFLATICALYIGVSESVLYFVPKRGEFWVPYLVVYAPIVLSLIGVYLSIGRIEGKRYINFQFSWIAILVCLHIYWSWAEPVDEINILGWVMAYFIPIVVSICILLGVIALRAKKLTSVAT